MAIIFAERVTTPHFWPRSFPIRALPRATSQPTSLQKSILTVTRHWHQRAIFWTGSALSRRLYMRAMPVAPISQVMPANPVSRVTCKDWQVQIGGEMNAASVTFREDGADISVRDHTIALDTNWSLGDPVFAARLDGEAAIFQIDRLGVSYRVTHRGVEALAESFDPTCCKARGIDAGERTTGYEQVRALTDAGAVGVFVG